MWTKLLNKEFDCLIADWVGSSTSVGVTVQWLYFQREREVGGKVSAVGLVEILLSSVPGQNRTFPVFHRTHH